jgi:hypothetical protein
VSALPVPPKPGAKANDLSTAQAGRASLSRLFNSLGSTGGWGQEQPKTGTRSEAANMKEKGELG